MNPANTTTVHIAEDKTVLRLGFAQILRTIPGCEVIGETADGQSTIDRVCELLPNILFIRLDLPGIDGIKVTQRIKKKTPEVAVIMLLTDPRDFFMATDSGADGYIMRDTPEHLISVAMQTVTAGGAWIGPLVAEYLVHGDGLPKLQNAPTTIGEVPGLDKLTPREREVLRLVSRGLSNKKVGDALGLKLETVKVHMRNILKKLDVEGRTEAIAKVLTSIHPSKN